LCRPAKRNTVAIDACSGSQLASAADAQALAMIIAANKPALVRMLLLACVFGHAVKGIFAVRSILVAVSAGSIRAGKEPSAVP
jgi:hypothetical protein